MSNVAKYKLSKIITMLLVSVVLFFSVVQEVEARRMGGGGSFGGRRTGQLFKQSKAPTKTNKATNTTKGSATKGVLGGLAAGLGLAWLASSLGLGAGFANILLIALLAFMAMAVLRFFASHSLAQHRAAYDSNNNRQDRATANDFGNGGFSAQDAQAVYAGFSVPPGFDTIGFNQACESNFIALQQAWERADLIFMRSMMTDDMFALMRDDLQQCQARGESRKAKVLQVTADLLGLHQMPGFEVAAVKFSGLIDEGEQTNQVFNEVWTLVRTAQGKEGWLLDGISQLPAQ